MSFLSREKTEREIYNYRKNRLIKEKIKKRDLLRYVKIKIGYEKRTKRNVPYRS